MTKQLIGTAVTDENGIATLQYKCGGRGKFQITAESGGLVSGTYELLDALFFDTGMDNSTSSKYVNGADITYSGDGMTFPNPKSNNKWFVLKVGGQSSSYVDINQDYCIEFEGNEDSNTSNVAIGIGGANTNIPSVYKGELHTFKVEAKNKTTKLYIDNVYISGSDHTVTTNGDIAIAVNNGSITIKNLKVYYI